MLSTYLLIFWLSIIVMDITLLLLVHDDEFHDFSLEIITIVLIYFV